jgi:hypothetical protein
MKERDLLRPFPLQRKGKRLTIATQAGTRVNGS